MCFLTSYFCIPVLYNENDIFWGVLFLKGHVGLHRTVQLEILQCYWLGHKLGLSWYWMVCLRNEQWSFCLFWDCIQVLHFRLFVDYDGYSISFKGFLPFPVHLRMRPVSRGYSRHSHVDGDTCRKTWPLWGAVSRNFGSPWGFIQVSSIQGADYGQLTPASGSHCPLMHSVPWNFPEESPPQCRGYTLFPTSNWEEIITWQSFLKSPIMAK